MKNRVTKHKEKVTKHVDFMPVLVTLKYQHTEVTTVTPAREDVKSPYADCWLTA